LKPGQALPNRMAGMLPQPKNLRLRVNDELFLVTRTLLL